MTEIRRNPAPECNDRRPVLADVTALRTAPISCLSSSGASFTAAKPRLLAARICRVGWRTASRNWPFGGLKPETAERLEALGEQLDGGKPEVRNVRLDDRPIAGTRLVREYRGIEHVVTVLQESFEHEGRPYKSLSAIARAITGTYWNGPVFFSLRNQRSGA